MVALSGKLILAESVEEAVDAKQADPDLEFLAGGTDTYQRLGPAGSERRGFISLRRVEALRGVTEQAGVVTIGALTTVAEIRTDPTVANLAPMLAQAARALGSRQVRARATVGGNVCTSRADHTLVPGLLALDAQVNTTSATGSRAIPLADFLAGCASGEQPGQELVTGISFQSVPGFQDFTRVGPRNGPCYAIASVALVVDAAARQVRLGAGNAGPTTVRATAAEEWVNQQIDWDRGTAGTAACEGFGQRVADASDPPTDTVSSSDYRRHALGVMARRILERADEEGLR